jgi:chromosomal replication initiator protein
VTSDPDAIWTTIQAELRRAVTDSTYHLWLAPLRMREITGHDLVIAAPDEIRSTVTDHFIEVIEACAAVVLGPATRVTVTPPAGPTPVRRAHVATGRPASAPAAEVFNPKLTFEQFVIGDANRLAHAAALAVAELPGQAYNPLFVYGPPGLGKTHLLHAIGNYLAVNEPMARVRYTTVEAFTTAFVNATHRGGSMGHFKALYRDTDVLLIDDVQFLASKTKTEEEFFHTFNALYDTGAQLVLTSDRLPGDLDALEDRLRERFASGLVTDVRPPDMATRLTILRKRVQHDAVDMASDEVLERIAARLPANIRTLEGALIRVVAFHSLTRKPLDCGLVDEVLAGLYPTAHAGPPSVRDVQEAICAAFELSLDDLRSPSRASRLAWPRQIAMYLARELTGASLPAIGREFGGRNHTTVVHACKRTAERMAADRGAYDAVHRVSRQLGGTE